MAKVEVKTILDTIFNCDCGCENQLNVGDFKDGQFTFTVKDKSRYHEVIISPKDIKSIIKLLNN